MRRALTSLGVIGWFVLVSGEARAADLDRCRGSGDSIACQFRRSEVIPAGRGAQGASGVREAAPARRVSAPGRGSGLRSVGPSRRAGARKPAPPTTTFFDVGTNSDGRSCYRVGREPVPGGADVAAAQQAADRELEDRFINTRGRLPRCEEATTRPRSPSEPRGAQPDLRGVVVDYWAGAEQLLPRPRPRIQPGRAVTGKKAYLELGDLGTQSSVLPNPLGGEDARITATPTYEIDWGDGTVTTTRSTGGPWPHGDVTHVYQDVGHYDVVVTARWEGQWSGAPGEGGPLEALTTEGRIERFPVTEIQAVRER